MKEKQSNEKLNEEKSGLELNTDENISGTTHLNDPLTDESELEKLRSELDEVNDRYMRKVAEFENFRKRSAKEKIELIQTAGKDVIISLLEVLDDGERAEKQITQNAESQNVEGMLLVLHKLRNILAARGLKAMESINQEFNPDLHEAITELPVEDEKMKGKVVDELQKGYYLNDKIIRFAKVVVGK